jgi:hypothetical protein
MKRARRRGRFAAGLVLLLAVGPTAGVVRLQAQGLPSRLTDTEFWHLSESLSEPNGYFRSDNLLSNETGYQYVIPELLNTVRPGGVYLGVAPEQNFTYIVALHPAMAFIVDIRRGNLLEHLMYKALIELSTDRASFLSHLFSRPEPADLDSTTSVDSLFAIYDRTHPDSTLYRTTLQAIDAHLTRDHGFALDQEDLQQLAGIFNAFYEAGPEISYSFPRQGYGYRYGRGMPNYYDLMVQTDGAGTNRGYLATEANYRTLREFELKNLLVPVVGNFGGPRALRDVGNYIRAHHSFVMAFYTSNVEQYLWQDGIADKFYDNVATLPLDSTSTFIRSAGGGYRGMGNGFRLGSLLSSMPDFIAQFKAGKIQNYFDVIQASH